MSEIKVGEYVRTVTGSIDKVDALYDLIENTIHLENHKWQDIKNIVKHSPNIIDLIEEGDYVNGYKVIDIKGGYLYIDKINLDTELYETLVDYQIFSVVTKKQFANAEYRLEE